MRLKFFKLVVLLCFLFAVNAKAQVSLNVNNQSNCDLQIWAVCVDQFCNVVSETLYNINAGSDADVTFCNTMAQSYIYIKYDNVVCQWSAGLYALAPIGLSCFPSIYNNTISISDLCECSILGNISINYTTPQITIW